MYENRDEDYIRTARAKGLTRMRVIVIHALRNAMLPVVTVLGLQVGTLLAVAVYYVMVVTVFTWLFRALENRLDASGNVYGNDFPTERRPLYRYQ